jgi:hypothetical protein
MKVIVVSGARSGIGKTYLARALRELLPGAVRVKIGHHARKPGGDDGYYYMGTRFQTIAADHRDAPYLVIESNRILEEITPECVIYLPGRNPKPSAALAAAMADIVRGKVLAAQRISLLAKRLQCSEDLVRRIAEASGAFPEQEPDRTSNALDGGRDEPAGAKPSTTGRGEHPGGDEDVTNKAPCYEARRVS